MADFIQVAGSHVRLDSIVRLSDEAVAGSPGLRAYYCYVSDGSILSVTEAEYTNIRRTLIPDPKSKTKTTKTKGATA